MAIDYKKIAAEAANITDQSETKAGGDFERNVPAAGVTMGRFIEYIELGFQPQRAFQGKAKPDAATARFTFEFLAKKNIREVEIEGEKRTFADRISFELPISLSEKSGFKKLFNAMRYGREVTHFAQMLNDAFVFTIVHNEVEKDGKKRVYANIKNDSGWLIQAPVVVDPVQGTETKVPVPPAMSDIKLFIWERPCKETWASLHISGTRTVKDEKGNEREVSKNWLQEKILEASNFQGSPLEELLTDAEGEVTEAIADAEEKPIAAKKSPAPAAAKPALSSTKQSAKPVVTAKTASPSKAAPVVKKAGVTPAVAAKKSEKASAPAVDPLAALGLLNQ